MRFRANEAVVRRALQLERPSIDATAPAERPGIMNIDELTGGAGKRIQASHVAFDERSGAPPPPGAKGPGYEDEVH